MGRTVKSITFRQLRYPGAVAEAESFTGAARLMKVSQPAISEQLRLLECRLGVSLFCREKKRILLTPRDEPFISLPSMSRLNSMLCSNGPAPRAGQRAEDRPLAAHRGGQALSRLWVNCGQQVEWNNPPTCSPAAAKRL